MAAMSFCIFGLHPFYERYQKVHFLLRHDTRLVEVGWEYFVPVTHVLEDTL